MKKYIYPISLVLLFIILIAAVIPDGYIYGSNTDWLSQHVTLAETIRDTCLEKHTLLPSWTDLGGGSNGYQLAYYGFLRPDILIGCLLPGISMLHILTVYMVTLYLVSVLLCFIWLKSEGIRPVIAFAGTVLFMTAGCLFHMHRQVMFVNYLPFLLLAFLCIRKERTRWLPLCLCLICLSSFYFSISAFICVGWYWYQKEGSSFWKNSFLKKYVPSTAVAAGMSAALLIPTALVLLEHGRSGGKITWMSILELFAPNPVMNNLFFNEYGLGLTFICLYAILAGLTQKAFRRNSLLFLLFGLFGIFSWLLNGALYARPKILIPFMPLIILHCARCFQTFKKYPLWPFAAIFPISLLWFSQEQFPWIIADALLLLCFILLTRRAGHKPARWQTIQQHTGFRLTVKVILLLLLLTAPVGLYITTAGTEDWVKRSEASPGFTSREMKDIPMDPLYHFDSLLSPLVSGNELAKAGLTRSTMYSSIMNQAYSSLYHDTLKTPVRINNRVALLTSDNPFMFSLLGVRYVETTADHIPAGYEIIRRSGNTVIAENKNVLPRAYFTDDTVSQETFEKLNSYEKLDVLTRKTVVENAASKAPQSRMEPYTPDLSAASTPDGLDIQRTADFWEITASNPCTLELDVTNPVPGNVLLLEFQVQNLTHSAVVIDINGIRNKLSGTFAAYPNGNNCFQYQFATDTSEGITKLSITFGKGHYIIFAPRWHVYEQKLLSEKKYTPLALTDAVSQTGDSLPVSEFGTVNVLSGIITADSDGYLATSIPVQNGLEILVDGVPAQTVTVNTAFAGAALTEGTHRIDIRFSPPGKTAGYTVSLVSAVGYGAYMLLCTWCKHKKRRTKKRRDII